MSVELRTTCSCVTGAVPWQVARTDWEIVFRNKSTRITLTPPVRSPTISHCVGAVRVLSDHAKHRGVLPIPMDVIGTSPLAEPCQALIRTVLPAPTLATVKLLDIAACSDKRLL